MFKAAVMILVVLFSGIAFAAPANLDWEVAQGEDSYITMTFTDEYGDPVDVSADSFYYTAISAWSSDTLSIDTAAIAKSGSGLGVVDTITLHITDTGSDMARGYYIHALGRVAPNGDKELVVRGRLLVTNNADPLGW